MRRYLLLPVVTGIALLGLVLLMTTMDAGSAKAAPASAPLAAPARAPRFAPLAQPLSPTYQVSDSNQSGGPSFQWVEIRDSGTPILQGTMDNRGSGSHAIGFYFPFFDQVYSHLRASSNGYIYFGGSAADGTQVPILIGSSSGINNFIAPFGTDLYLVQGVSAVYLERQTSPERRTIIEFVDVQWCCGLNLPNTFEVILYPDGRILLQYLQVRYLSNPHAWVVAGIENADGSRGIAYYQDWFDENDTLQDGLAVLFDPGNSVFGHLLADPTAHEAYEDPGWVLTFTTDIVNLTGITDTFDVTYSLSISSAVVPTPALWAVNVPTSVGPISNTYARAFDVVATLPLSAAWEDLAVMAVTVTAQTSPTLSTTLQITYGVAQRDLRVTKGLVPDTPAPGPGGAFGYLIEVGNGDYPGSSRGATARGVRLTDTLPFSATLVGFLASQGTVTTATVGSTVLLTWEVGTLERGITAQLGVAMEASSALSIGTVLTNTAGATMTASRERGPFDNNRVVYTLTIAPPFLDFDLSKDGPGQIGPGEVATFTLSVINRGNVPITGTLVTDTLPPGTAFYATTWPTYSLPTSRTVVFTVGLVNNAPWNALSFQIGISVPPTTPVGTWLTNTAEVTTTASLSGFTSANGDTAQATMQVVDLRGDPFVYKRLPTQNGSPIPPEPGGDYTFWIQYGNAGYVTVYSVTLTDTLPPAYVTLLEATPAGGNVPITATPGLITWTLDSLVPGQSGWVRVRLLVDANAPAGTQLVNRAGITVTSGGNITLTNDQSTVTATLQAADVTVHKVVTPAGTLQVGDRLTYTLHFTNTGPLSATGVVLTDVLPDGLTDVAWVTDGHPITLTAGPHRLVWEATAPMGTGDHGTITVTARLDPAATWPAQPILTNTATIATVRGEEPPPDDDPNTATVTNTVALASPYVTKEGPTLALPGELITYTLGYGNPGLLPADGVWLTDTLPVGTFYVTDTSGYPLHQAGGTVGWFLGTVPSRTTGITFHLVLSAPATLPVGTVLQNQVVLTTTSYDGDRTDNTAIWMTPVGYDLSGSYKRANGQPGLWIAPGRRLTYTVVLTNRGPYSATAVTLTDPLPLTTTFVSGSLMATGGQYGYDPSGRTVTWTGTVTGYTAVTVTFQVTVAPSGAQPRGTVIVNTASISDGTQLLQASVPVTLTGPNLSGSYKTVDNAGPLTGQRITFTIVLSNSGEVTATARVTDLLPVGTVYAGGGGASGGTLLFGTPVTWTGVVTPGGRVTLTLPATVTALPGSTMENVAWIDDGAGVVLRRSQTVSVLAPDLDHAETVKVASTGAVTSGGRVTYTLRLVNRGTAPTTARLTDTLPTGLAYAGGGSASGGTLGDGAAPLITWTGTLAANGGAVTITLPAVVTATPGSDLLNVAWVDDGAGRVFSRTASLHVYTAPDLSGSTKEVTPTVVRRGDLLTYTLRVRNGGEAGTAFRVTDTLGSGVTFEGFLGADAGSYGQAGGVITWTGTAAGGAEIALRYRVLVQDGAASPITNTARFDDGQGNRYDRTAPVTLAEPVPDGVKTATPAGTVFPNSTITYTIVLSNSGGVAASLWLSDPIPSHTLYVAGSLGIGATGLGIERVPPGAMGVSDAGYNYPIYHPLSRTITWEDDLLPGKRVTLVFAVFVEGDVAAGTRITNTVWVEEQRNPTLSFTRSVAHTVTWRAIYLPVVVRNGP